MKSLASKNYESVHVFIRGAELPIKMDPKRGRALMDYLTSQSPGVFVIITDDDSSEVLVKTTEIVRIEPIYKQETAAQALERLSKNGKI